MLINPYVFGGPWTPAMTTTALWLDAADSSMVTTISGGVSQWSDKSGNGRHATQSTAGIRPTYSANTISFSSQGLEVPVAGAPGISQSLICVMQSSSTGSASAGLINAANSGLNNPENRIGVGDQIRLYWNAAYAVDYNASLVSTKNIVVIEFNGATSPLGVSVYKNGSLATSGSRNASWSSYDRFTIGYHRTPSNNYRNGSINELFVTNTNSTTRQLAEGYLAWKWDLVASLPAGHPYKSAAPII